MNVNEFLGQDGVLSRFSDGYEVRPQQLKMANLVEKAITDKTHAVIEGSTGVGKSFAYLIPILLKGETAIVSTSNKSLQDQLNTKDLPKLKEVFEKANLGQLNWVTLKGKNNYFCMEHLITNQHELKRLLTDSDIEVIKNWGAEDPVGDLDYFPGDLLPKVRELICCDSETKHEQDSPFREFCGAQRARDLAKEAQVVLVNHTLLAMDMKLRDMTDGFATILPATDIVVIDEAHNFEKLAIKGFSDSLNYFSLKHFTDRALVQDTVPPELIRATLRGLQEALEAYLPEKVNGYYQQTKHDSFAGFGLVKEQVRKMLELVTNSGKVGNGEEAQKRKESVKTEGANLVARLEAFEEEDENTLKWAEARDLQDSARLKGPLISLNSTPLSINDLVKSQLLSKNTVICTSATLATNNNFNFFKAQMGLEDCYELIVDSPFPFKDNCLVYTSNGEYEPFDEAQELLRHSKGRAFVLFTAYKDMREYYQYLDIPYPKFIQEMGKSRVQLVEDFLNTENAVLFATRSFWEGVDIPGEKLSLVIIQKIPFANPSDLIYSTKTKLIDKKYGVGAHWGLFTIPDACIALKQGAGRLIRTATDKGVIALLDSRVNVKNYGKAVMNSFPKDAPRTQKLENVRKFFDKIAS